MIAYVTYISHVPFLVGIFFDNISQMLHAVSSSSSLISLSSFSLLFTIQSKSLWQLFDEFCFFAWCAMVSSWSLSKTSGVVNTSTSFAWTHLCLFLEIQLFSLCSQKIGELWLVLLLVVNPFEGSQDQQQLLCSHHHQQVSQLMLYISLPSQYFCHVAIVLIVWNHLSSGKKFCCPWESLRLLEGTLSQQLVFKFHGRNTIRFFSIWLSLDRRDQHQVAAKHAWYLLECNWWWLSFL